MVQMLLDAGVDSSLGLTDAILYHHTNIVHLLLASGAKHNVDANNGDALLTACERGHLEMMKLLLDAGANPLACDGECMNRACREGTLFN